MYTTPEPSLSRLLCPIDSNSNSGTGFSQLSAGTKAEPTQGLWNYRNIETFTFTFASIDIYSGQRLKTLRTSIFICSVLKTLRTSISICSALKMLRTSILNCWNTNSMK